MKVLLINQNATIDRLVTLSTGKLLFELSKAGSVSEATPAEYDFVIVDSDVFEEGEFEDFKQACKDATFLMIMSKGFAKPSGFDVFIEKPFLPTELVDILSTVRASSNTFESPKFEDTFSQSLNSSDEIPSLDDLDMSDDSPIGELDIGEMITLDEEELQEPSFDGMDEIKLDELSESDSFGMDEIKLDELDLDDSSHDTVKMDDENELSFDGIDFGDDLNESKDSDLPAGAELELDEGGDDFSIDDLKLDDADDKLDDKPLEHSVEDEIELDGFDDAAIDLGETSTENNDVSLDDGFSLDEHSDEVEVEVEVEVEETTEEDELLGALDKLNEELQNSKEDGEFASIDEEESDVHENTEDEEEEIKVPSSIFGDDEVKKLKDLLDEAESEEVGFDPSEVSIQSDDLGSLTEESLAEALGVELDNDIENGDFGDIGLENLDSPAPSAKIAEPVPAQNVEMSATELFSIPLDKLKMLLDTADITINITLSKKK